ncbi:unnamed protein product [Moneuplotes crassus]|uniref:Protein kinase domain-containing protein n=1 Tax=Euplotes crassus TaxID=5936 RepID=A0AAD1XZF3_EUPCR|nr:unnamed protein product [Moneuplotes crassus]
MPKVGEVDNRRAELIRQNATKRLKEFQLELDCLSKLNHDKIVDYFGYQKETNVLNIFLEYFGEGSLESLLNLYGKLREPVISNYTKQILQGLEYLHSNNIIHRDIKAGNILVKQGICKLTDFGASKEIYEKMGKQIDSFKGTPYWMAPEVITQKGYGRFADIWSLGCTVFEMLTGAPPWSEQNQYAVLFQIANESRAPDYPDDISDELRDFMDCCFKKEPTERCNIYELLHHPFILQEECDVEDYNILSNGLTIADDRWLQESQNELKERHKNPPKAIELLNNCRRGTFQRMQTKPLLPSQKIGVKMSMKQLEALYKLIQLRNIGQMYEEMTQKKNLPCKSPDITPQKSSFGNLMGIRRKKRQLSSKLIPSRMGDIQEESEDCGTPTPGKLQMENYTFCEGSMPNISKKTSQSNLAGGDARLPKTDSLNESYFDKTSECEGENIQIKSSVPEELEAERKKIEEQIKIISSKRIPNL